MKKESGMPNTEKTSVPVPEGSWREDGMFMEFGCYGQTDGLDDPRSSGFNLIGGGGTLPHDDVDDENEGADEHEERNDRAVVFYLQKLDTGEDMETRLTPEAARRLAERLTEWAEDAELGMMTVEEAIEAERTAWYAKGGMDAR